MIPPNNLFLVLIEDLHLFLFFLSLPKDIYISEFFTFQVIGFTEQLDQPRPVFFVLFPPSLLWYLSHLYPLRITHILQMLFFKPTLHFYNA